ncbi:MAG: hypothetical protein E6G58_11915 [Actinobacteria bacterium]|nr:MAG: hypothetical protein E6G58_11915 [Actinomycetota bacterium]
MLRRSIAVLVTAGASLAVLAGPAAAAGPVRVPFESTRIIAAGPDTCPFAITSHVSGTFLVFNHADGSQKVTVADFFVTWSNPLSGLSMTTALAGPFITSAPNGDGTVTVTIDGNDGIFVAPGQGVIYGAVGRLVYIADESDPTTPLVLLQSSGIQDPSPFPSVCSALA